MNDLFLPKPVFHFYYRLWCDALDKQKTDGPNKSLLFYLDTLVVDSRFISNQVIRDRLKLLLIVTDLAIGMCIEIVRLMRIITSYSILI